tara:strand:+ start:3639 stop:3965 length:327 start_codon:yes stop_codon:yes gene_type:complete
MDNKHTTILLIILVLSVTFIGVTLKEDFTPGYTYIPVKNTRTPFSKIFNIDTMKHTEQGNLGWKKFWRDNFSKFSGDLDQIYVDKPFKYNPKQRLLFDGVRNAQENTI